LKVLIVYGTSEGQTRKIAERAAQNVRERGHEAELRDSADVASGLNLERFDAFIIAASVHHEYHQTTVRDFVTAHRRALDTKPSAFISVSLSAVLEGAQPEAKKYAETFLAATGCALSFSRRAPPPSTTLPRQCSFHRHEGRKYRGLTTRVHRLERSRRLYRRLPCRRGRG
jgi:hypothetical protein